MTITIHRVEAASSSPNVALVVQTGANVGHECSDSHIALSRLQQRLATVIAPMMIVLVLFSAPSTARAEPVTLGAFLLGWLTARGLNSLVDLATGAPNVRQMQKELETLAKSDRVNAGEINRLRGQLDEKLTRQEVEKLLMASLVRVDSTLAEHAQRILALETAVGRLHIEVSGLREEDRHLRADIAFVQKQLNDANEKLLIHELRIRDLEQAVGVRGASAFKSYRSGNHADALLLFDEALAIDPTDSGLHFGRAFVLKKLERDQEAEQAITSGLAAERIRRPGKWYGRVMEGVQGTDRNWFEGQRRRLTAKRSLAT
jgi:tetratricopeptide (TPR) repeat protein